MALEPKSSAPFFGRETELARFEEKLGQTRLLTVVGMPGIGKAHFLRHAMALTSMRPYFHGDVPTLGDIDRTKVHVVNSDKPLTLAQCREIQSCVRAGLHVVALNPRPLFLVEEALFRLGSLNEKATQSLYRFELQRHDVQGIDEERDGPRFWRATGGVPTVIQIAALHRVHFSHEEVLKKLERGVHHFPQALLERYPTFAGACHDLLASFEEQTLVHFASFSLWNAPFSAQECLAIFGTDALTSLRELCDASLIHVATSTTPPQHSLLAPLQHLAAERFSALSPDTRGVQKERFLNHYSNPNLLTENASASVSSLTSAFTMARGKAKATLAHHLAARLQATDSVKEVSALLSAALEEDLDALDRRNLLFARAHHLLVYGGAHSPQQDIAAAKALTSAAMGAQHFRTLALFERRHGDFEAAVAYYKRALECIKDPKERTLCFSDLAGHYFENGRLEESRAVFESALVVAAAEAKPVLQTNYALLQQASGDFESAESLLLKSLAAHRAQGHQRFVGISLGDLAGLAFEEGLFLKAERYYREAIEILIAVGDMRHSSLMEHALWALNALCGKSELRPSSFDSQLPEWRQASDLYGSLVDKNEIENTLGDADEIQLALRIVRRHQEQEPSLLLTRSGLRYRVGAQIFSCEKRPLLARLLNALVRDRFEKRAPGLSMEGLMQAGWPDEEVREGGENRVYVALTALRKQGLKNVIIKNKEGYSLDANVHVRWVSSLA